MTSIFVSYSSKDRDLVLQIVNDLVKAGYTVWFDRQRIDGGKKWAGEIVDGIEQCDYFIILVSNNSLLSDNVRKELELAAEDKKNILPIYLETIDRLPHAFRYHLAGLQFVDFTAGSGLQNILKILPSITLEDEDTFCFGKIRTTWSVIDGSGEEPYAELICSYNDTPLNLPPDLKQSRDRIIQIQEERRKNNEHVAWNGERYYLDQLVIERTNNFELPIIKMRFGPSDYYTFLSTNMKLHEYLDENTMQTFYQRYFLNTLWDEPVRYFTNSFGVNLAVITKDNFLLLTKRGRITPSRPGEIGISVNEGLSRSLDHDIEKNAPDLYNCAVRGAKEELGLALTSEDIQFLSIGVDTKYSQWGILGITCIEKTKDEVFENRKHGVQDKWENSRLFGISFSPDEVAKFIFTSSEIFLPAALTCIYHALINKYGREEVDKIIATYR